MRANVKVTWRGDLASKKSRDVAKKALGEVTEFILQESNKIAPLDEGTLIRSGNTDVGVTAKGMSASVYYDTPYAARLHEHPEYNFQNGREGKYLEKTINKEASTVATYLRDNYRDAFS